MTSQPPAHLTLARTQLEGLCKPFLVDLYAADTEEISINPDGLIHITDRSKRILSTTLSENQAKAIIHLVCTINEIEPASFTNPLIETVFPLNAGRFSASIFPYNASGSKHENPDGPLSKAPSISIRCPAVKCYSLEQYVAAGIMSAKAKELICKAIADSRAIVVSGSTQSGKTTLLNAILLEMATQHTQARFITIQEVAELKVFADDVLQLLALPPMSMEKLAIHSLRRSPDRLIFGEVRGPEALVAITSWATGHVGGALTIHADSSEDMPNRLVEACSQSYRGDPSILHKRVARALDLVVHIQRDTTAKTQRSVTSITEILDYDYTSRTFNSRNLYTRS